METSLQGGTDSWAVLMGMKGGDQKGKPGLVHKGPSLPW